MEKYDVVKYDQIKQRVYGIINRFGLVANRIAANPSALLIELSSGLKIKMDGKVIELSILGAEIEIMCLTINQCMTIDPAEIDDFGIDSGWWKKAYLPALKQIILSTFGRSISIQDTLDSAFADWAGDESNDLDDLDGSSLSIWVASGNLPLESNVQFNGTIEPIELSTYDKGIAVYRFA